MKKVILLLPLVFLLISPLAKADDVWTMAQSQQYGRKVGGMLGRGFLNLATCFVDVIVATVDGTKNGPPVIGTVTGLGKGIGCTALRALSGALDVTTFWVPGFNGYAVCKSYADCVSCQKQEAAPGASMQQPTYQEPAPTVVQAPEPYVARRQNPMKYIKK